MFKNWQETWEKWQSEESEEPRPPVFIIICKEVKLAKVIYEWLAENKAPVGIPPSDIKQLHNINGRIPPFASIQKCRKR